MQPGLNSTHSINLAKVRDAFLKNIWDDHAGLYLGNRTGSAIQTGTEIAPTHDRQRQWHRAHLERHIGLAGRAADRVPPGKPMQNGFVSKALTEGCAMSVSMSTCSPTSTRPRQIIEEWRIDYNTNRPHTSLNGLTPTEFATHFITPENSSMSWPSFGEHFKTRTNSRGPRKIAVAFSRRHLWGEQHRIGRGTNRNPSRANSGG